MPAFCCVLNCGSRGKRDPVKFFRIPVGRNFKHRQDINRLTTKRRQMWIQAIRRMGLTEQKLKNALVCSKHFVSGKPAELEDILNTDWVPTVDMGYESLVIKSEPTGVSNDYKCYENQMATEIKEIASNKVFDGYQKVFSHDSKELGCSMKFGIFLPPSQENKTYPVIYWLSGLTCTENNFIEKSGAQRYAAQHGVIIVNPDTSPRGVNIPGSTDSWDFGEGAGFYVDATQKPWKEHYRMYSYVTKELIEVIEANFPVTEGARSIMGHSMGGHGALISALKNPTLYKSVSAFAPICNPSVVPWGIKALSGYLGPKETSNWEEWDATELVKKYNGPPLELFIDQGLDDNFLTPNQLCPDNLIEACRIGKVPLIAKKREGYNHSYFFIATFIEEHIKYHAQHLGL